MTSLLGVCYGTAVVSLRLGATVALLVVAFASLPYSITRVWIWASMPTRMAPNRSFTSILS